MACQEPRPGPGHSSRCCFAAPHPLPTLKPSFNGFQPFLARGQSLGTNPILKKVIRTGPTRSYLFLSFRVLLPPCSSEPLLRVGPGCSTSAGGLTLPSLWLVLRHGAVRGGSTKMGAGTKCGTEGGQWQHPHTREQPPEPRDCFRSTF